MVGFFAELSLEVGQNEASEILIRMRDLELEGGEVNETLDIFIFIRYMANQQRRIALQSARVCYFPTLGVSGSMWRGTR